MRTIKGLPIPQDTDLTKFPDGQIQNESVDGLTPGTPVVREIYGDVLTNVYAILKAAGITADEVEDSSLKGYQILEALQKLPNVLNDLQQLITVSGTDMSVLFNFDHLPNNYVFIGKVTEDIIAQQVYDFTGTGAAAKQVTSTTDVVASSIVLIILNGNQSNLIDLNPSTAAQNAIINTSFGNPLSFNESNDILFLQGAVIVNSYPKSFLIENLVQIAEANANLKLLDAVYHKSRLVAMFFDTVALKYRLWSFLGTNLAAIEGEITIPDTFGVDNRPYMFCDGSFLYFTNSGAAVNSAVNDYTIGKFLFNENTLIVSSVSTGNLDVMFEKTTNTFITNDKFYTLISGVLYAYEIGVVRAFIDDLNIVNGQVFKQGGQTYYSTGEIANLINF